LNCIIASDFPSYTELDAIRGAIEARGVPVMQY